MFKSILVVCAGNICRSPAAEYVLKNYLSQNDVEVNSAGIIAQHGKSVDKQMLDTASVNGIDLSPHKSQKLTGDLVYGHDLILVMETQHLQDITQKYPDARGKTFLLGKWLDDRIIPDPYRKSDEMFRHVYTLIDQACQSWQTYL